MVKPLPAISSTFDEGRYFDLWMLVHALGGVTGGFSNLFFALSTPRVYAVGAALMIAWEGAEYLRGIRESWENRVLDIVLGLLGVAFALAVAARLGPQGQLIAFVSSGSLFAWGSWRGWLAYRRRLQDPS